MRKSSVLLEYSISDFYNFSMTIPVSKLAFLDKGLGKKVLLIWIKALLMLW